MKHNSCQLAGAPSPAPPELLPGGRILAAPSWVRPGSLAENCAWLAGKVHEVGLLFLESRACLAYDQADLPPWLAALPLRWHVHLPVDLPWTAGPEGPSRAAEICLALLDKLDFLGLRRAVLHPPPAGSEILQPCLDDFVAAWQAAGRASRDLLLENLPETATARDWEELVEAVRRLDCSFCFDFGHFLLHNGSADSRPGQEVGRGIMDLLPDILHVTGLFHCCTAAHRPLTQLSAPEREACADICRQALALSPADAVFMLELFRWEDIEASLPLLQSWLEQGEAGRPVKPS